MTEEELAIEPRRTQQLTVGKRPGVSKMAEKDTLVEVNGGEGFKKLAVNRLSVTEYSSKSLLHLATGFQWQDISSLSMRGMNSSSLIEGM